uniref:Prolactin-induced protein n=1 Tax=Loxodonta africana TaxID=9785 RepID=G3U5A5_LOXAF
KRFLQLLSALHLIFCLQLGTSNAQEDTGNIISLSLKSPQNTTTGESFWVVLMITNNKDESMEVRTHLVSFTKPKGACNFTYTACLCGQCTRNFYYEVAAYESGTIKGTAEVVSAENICPDDEVVYPELGYKACVEKPVTVV